MAGLYQVTFGQVSSPTDLNQLVTILSQPSGGVEKGHYFLASGIYTSGAVISTYVPTLTRNTAPVSVSVDTADLAPTGGLSGTPTTLQLTSGGFQVYSLSTTGPNVNARAGGNYTANY